MANRNSQAIANAIATPKVLNSPQRSKGNIKEVAAIVTPATDEDAFSLHRFMRVPSNARISSLKLSAADAAGGAYNIGLYNIENGPGNGAVVDSGFFASAFDLTAGPHFNADAIQVTQAAGVIADSEKTVWELLGLAKDPNVLYDVAALVDLTFSGGPTAVLMKLTYVQ